VDTKKPSNPNQLALARLGNAGLVDLAGEPALSDHVRYWLML
jgi:hypothetical protein